MSRSVAITRAAFPRKGVGDGPPDPLSRGRDKAGLSLQASTHGRSSCCAAVSALGFVPRPSDALQISSRIVSRRRFCRPSESKFSGASQASNAALARGHSLSRSENQLVSRLRPLTIMC